MVTNKNSLEINDDMLCAISGGTDDPAATADDERNFKDPNFSGCFQYQCMYCGGKMFSHIAGCDASRPNCCGSCIHIQRDGRDWFCTATR